MQQQLTLSSTSYIQFKHINNTFETYLPKPKLISISGQLIINYVYKTNTVQSMGNLDDFPEGREIGDADQSKKEAGKVSKQQKTENKNKQQKKAEIISESKKKGIKDYTISLHHKSQHPKPSTILFPTAFRPTKLLSYFQLKLVEECEHPILSMGITSSNNQQHLPLQSSSSKSIVSLYFNIISSNVIEVFRNGNKLQQVQIFGIGIKEGSYVGIGLVQHANQVFVTVDGVICGKWRIFYTDLAEEKVGKGRNVTEFAEECTFKFYPFVILTNKNIKVECIFENSLTNFKFNYLAYTQQLQQRVLEHDIPRQTEVSQDFTYSLVLNYLKFHGHEKTSQIFENEMLKRNMKYYPQNEPLKNITSPAAQQNMQQIGKQKKIRKRTKKGSARRTQDPSPSLSMQVEIQSNNSNNNSNSNEQQPKNKEKDSSDSEQPIEQFLQLQGSSLLSRRGKLIEQGEEQEKEKKQQQQVHYVLNKKKMEKKVEELKRSETQKLKIQRVQIMKSIEEAQLEQALKLFSKFFKILYNREKHLQIFFKAHIFLKHYYKDGLQSALQYAKKQHKMFTLYENCIMPFYSKFNPGFTFRPLRQILFVICPQNHENFNFQRQLSIFAEFISQTICQFYGYFGSSKLELVLGHYRVVRKIVAQSGVAVAGIEAQMDDEI